MQMRVAIRWDDSRGKNLDKCKFMCGKSTGLGIVTSMKFKDRTVSARNQDAIIKKKSCNTSVKSSSFIAKYRKCINRRNRPVICTCSDLLSGCIVV